MRAFPATLPWSEIGMTLEQATHWPQETEGRRVEGTEAGPQGPMDPGTNGCVWVCMCPRVSWVARPMLVSFLVIWGAKWAPFWATFASTSGDLGVWGRPGGRLGAMLDPMAGQRAPSGRKRGKILTLWAPFWRQFSMFFPMRGSFFGDLVPSRFWEGFGTRCWRVLGNFF